MRINKNKFLNDLTRFSCFFSKAKINIEKPINKRTPMVELMIFKCQRQNIKSKLKAEIVNPSKILFNTFVFKNFRINIELIIPPITIKTASINPRKKMAKTPNKAKVTI